MAGDGEFLTNAHLTLAHAVDRQIELKAGMTYRYRESYHNGGTLVADGIENIQVGAKYQFRALKNTVSH